MIAELEWQGYHLRVDLARGKPVAIPLDRTDDQGLLANHRCWWGMESKMTTGEFPPQRRSVTEMMYVPDEVADAYYWLNLELQPLVSDATSSRPVIYPVEFTVP